MAYFSMPWETQTATGHGADSYTEAQAGDFLWPLITHDRAAAGVIHGYDNELEVSGSASPLTVETGHASVYNFRYWNDEALELDVLTPSTGDTGGRVILRADWALNTVRAVVLLNTDGTAAIPALTQTASTTWEISLASFVIDTSGDIWTDSGKGTAGVTDTRSYAVSALDGAVPIRVFEGDGSTQLIWTEIQQDFTHLMIVASAHITPTGNTNSMRFNNDSGSNYARANLNWNNKSETMALVASLSNIILPDMSNTADIVAINNHFDPMHIFIPGYNQTSLWKSIIAYGGARRDATVANTIGGVAMGWWKSTSAITRIDIFPGSSRYQTGSRFVLYGLR